MRPVDRGACPRDDTGRPIDFLPDYTLARGDLIERLGEYCSFCEARIQAGLHVEHILPKRPPGHTEDMPERVGDWDNFLLACVNCNSHKSTREFSDGECMFPDRDDTFSAIAYGEGGRVSPSASLSPNDRQRAMNLIDLVGLDAHPTQKRDLMRRSDRRWSNRFTAWKMAKNLHNDIVSNPDRADLVDNIVRLALADGHWSIWMHVFGGIPGVKEKLVSRFPGTEKKHFA